MIVLGIADNHDSGAALLIDGTLVAAINQERIDRKKNSGAFPWGAIDAVMDAGDVLLFMGGAFLARATSARALCR